MREFLILTALVTVGSGFLFVVGLRMKTESGVKTPFVRAWTRFFGTIFAIGVAVLVIALLIAKHNSTHAQPVHHGKAIGAIRVVNTQRTSLQAFQPWIVT